MHGKESRLYNDVHVRVDELIDTFETPRTFRRILGFRFGNFVTNDVFSARTLPDLPGATAMASLSTNPRLVTCYTMLTN